MAHARRRDVEQGHALRRAAAKAAAEAHGGALRSYRGPRHPMLLADNAAALRAFALDGLGIAVLPDWLVRADLRSGALQRLLADHGFPLQGVHAVYPPTRHLPSKVRAFIDFLKARLGHPVGG